ncbi:MAG: hypothetical protein JOZ70_02620, partial [Pseudolabrys sp.]|nr:hypothetical protein [Pseudolabrys sp.]
YLTAATPSERSLLESELRTLNSQLEKLIDAALPMDDQKYKNAVSAVANANKAIQTAIADLGAIAKAIGQIAQAISTIGKLVAAL